MSTQVTVTSISPDKGSLFGNNVITLTGSGFSSISNPAVNFGLAGATDIEVISDSKITVVNPNTASAGSVDVTLVNGATNISAGTFDYKLPKITGIHPSSSSLQGNEKITITGEYFTGAAAVNFGAAGASNINVISDTEITVTNPNAPKNEQVNIHVIVQGKSSNSCTASEFTYTSADAKGVPLLFSGETPQKTYIHFIGDSDIKGSYYDNNGNSKDLEANKAYALQDLTSGKTVAPNLPNGVPAVLIKSFSGRVYVSLEKPLTGLSSSYTPDAAGSNDPNYNTRYQYFEPTIKNSQMNIDLSYIDFTAISLSLDAFNAPHGTNKNQLSQNTAKLTKATGDSAKTKDGSVLPSSSDQYPNSSFARVISPQLGADSLYHDFTNYLKTVLKNKTVRIAGTYVGTGSQPSGVEKTQAQSYDYTATFDTNGNVTLSPNTGSGNGSAAGVPTAQQGPGVGTSGGDIKISFTDLNNKTGIYGCNTPYTLGSQPKTAGITNDIYGQVVGDLLSGLNFGYIGSTVQFNGSEISKLSSTEWWGGKMPDGTVIPSSATPGGQGIYFNNVQSSAANYNSYAGSISDLTTGYGFPLQDRLGKNLLTLNTAVDNDAYLMVWVDITPTS